MTKYYGGGTGGGPPPTPNNSFIIRNTLADLATFDDAAFNNGTNAYVVSEREIYQLDTANPLTTFSPLIVARGAGAGKWYRKSREYVVGNFTLWVLAFGGASGTGASTLVGFTPGQLLASAVLTPDLVLDLNGSINPVTETAGTIVPDSFGNPWVFANIGNGSVPGIGCKAYKFLLKDCLVSGSPTASVVVTAISPTPSNSYHGMFDKLNNLWISVSGRPTPVLGQVLYQYRETSYAETTSKPPDIIVSCRNASFGGPDIGTSLAEFMAIDGRGDIWFSCYSHIGGAPGDANGSIAMLGSAQLRATDSNVTPAIQWAGSNIGGSGIFAVYGVCFGPDGLLWTTNYPDSTLRAWDPRSPVSGNPAPVIILTSVTFNGPSHITFDTAGNLWGVNSNDPLVFRIPKASLGVSGAVIPDVILNAAAIGGFGSDITFPMNPNRSGLLPSGVPITP